MKARATARAPTGSTATAATLCVRRPARASPSTTASKRCSSASPSSGLPRPTLRLMRARVRSGRHPQQIAGATLVAPRREMTVQDLLRHTSGLTYGIFGNSRVDKMYGEAGVLDRTQTTEQFVARLAKM